MKSFAPRALLVAILCVAGPVLAAPKGVVQLHDSVSVPPGEVRLSQVATVTADDDSAAFALSRLVVARVGVARSEVRLTQPELARTLARQGAQHEWQWIGAHEVTLRVNAPEVPSEHIVQRAEEALRTALLGRCELRALKAISRPATLRVAPGEVTLRAKVLNATPQRRMVAEVEVVVGDAAPRTVAVAFEVQARAPAWVAARELRAGQVIAQADVQRGVAELPALQGAALPDEVIGLRLTRDAKPGDAIASTIVRRSMLVTRQDDVAVAMTTGSVQIASRGVALSDGDLGDRVRVQVGSEKLTARVAGPGQLVLGDDR
jgi:flagellar basal body P-ring formation protein FlgA